MPSTLTFFRVCAGSSGPTAAHAAAKSVGALTIHTQRVLSA